MDAQPEAIYRHDASICLIGMREFGLEFSVLSSFSRSAFAFRRRNTRIQAGGRGNRLRKDSRRDRAANLFIPSAGGVGKTTLGLIASTSLRRSFIDADAVFQTLNGPISSYVTAHGWNAFRDVETTILRKLLEEHPKNYVIACGGGVVEREANRELLRQFKENGGPIVHVVRDKEETIKYLVDEVAR